MSNHIHLIIKSEITELSIFMAKILAEYAEYYNYKHNRNGHVFQNRFQSECIESEKYFWNCVRYIHLNPIKAGIVKSMMNYKYSSIHEYKMGKTDILHEKAMKLFHGKFEKWDEFLDFHGNSQRQIFLDIKEEVCFQQKEVAIHMLQLMQYENGANKMREILENKELRTKYQEKMREELKVSNRRAKKIYEDIRQTIM